MFCLDYLAYLYLDINLSVLFIYVFLGYSFLFVGYYFLCRYFDFLSSLLLSFRYDKIYPIDQQYIKIYSKLSCCLLSFFQIIIIGPFRNDSLCSCCLFSVPFQNGPPTNRLFVCLLALHVKKRFLAQIPSHTNHMFCIFFTFFFVLFSSSPTALFLLFAFSHKSSFCVCFALLVFLKCC